jgi:hypothetical protein
MSDALTRATRVVAIVAGAAGAAGWFPVIGARFDIGDAGVRVGVAVVLTGFGVAGAALALRIIPAARRTPALRGIAPEVAARWRPTLLDLGILFAMSLFAAYLANTTLGGWGLDAWPLPALVQLLMVFGVLAGMLVGLVVLLPIALIGRAVVRRAPTGRG